MTSRPPSRPSTSCCRRVRRPARRTAGASPRTSPAFTAGNIALVQRGTCDFSVKAHNAYVAGAVGVIIFNEGQEGRTETLAATLGDAFSDPLPVIGTSFEIGNELAALLEQGPVTSTSRRTRSSSSTCRPRTSSPRRPPVATTASSWRALTSTRCPPAPASRTTAPGRRPCSRPRCSSAELGIEPRNTIRFAWWGAEEAGLVGSQRYVDSLTKSPGEGHRALPQLRHDRLPELRALRLRRRRLGIRHQGPERQLADRARLRGLLRLAGPGLGADGLRRALGLRRVHHGRHPRRRAVHRRRGRQDRGPGGRLYGGLATFGGEPVSYDPCYHQAVRQPRPHR